MILIVPARPDPERDSVAEAFPGEVLRLDRFWEVEAVADARVYGPDTFCQVVAQRLGLTLVAPDDLVLRHLDRRWTQRLVQCLPLGSVAGFPCFVKPVVPKMFGAAVYGSREELARATDGLTDDVPVLVSEIVRFACEVRVFVLEGVPVTWAAYEGEGEPPADWLRELAALPEWPVTVVLDVGLTERGWALVEANGTWGAGLNGCDPAAVARCLVHAAQ